MIFHDVKQNSDEWLDLRLGKLTGSNIGQVMANYGKSWGEPAKRLAHTIACEQITGARSVSGGFTNAHMERGHKQEPLARALYEDQEFTTVKNGGFFEKGNLGCSPDGLVGDNGLIEIKSVIIPTHYANIKRGNIPPEYKWQVYFNLKITERDWLDFVSYCADFPEESRLYTFRVFREDLHEQFCMIEERTQDFFRLVDETKKDIQELTK